MSVAVSHRVESPADSPVVRARRPRVREAESALDAWRASIDAARAASEENRRCSRRVRYEARDVAGVVLFSAGASTALAVVITLVLTLVG